MSGLEASGAGRDQTEGITGCSAREIARALRDRETSVPEVVQAHLELIHRLDPTLKAFVGLREEHVRAEAVQAQRALDSGAALGPLHGVPFTAKDILASGDPLPGCGSGAVPGAGEPAGAGLDRDATAIARIRAAGGLLLGKTACPEFAFGVDSQAPGLGPTGSPWGEGLTPGGSSGGEAAALAAHLSALGVGTDYGGSLRWPAACVGVAALRPTVGLVPGTGQLPGLATPDGYRVPNPVSVQGALQVVGLLAREVADLSLGLDVVGGPDGHDLQVRGGLRPPGADLARLRVGWLTREDTTPVRTDVADAVVAIVEALARAGLSTVACPGLLDGAAQAYATLREADGLEDLRAFVAGREHLLGGSLQALLHELAPTDPVRLARAWAGAIPVRSRVLAALGAAEGRAPAPPVDVLVCPVAPVPAFHRDHPVVVAGQVLSGFELMPLCRAVSLLGLPALSVPVGVSDEGLPINVQVVGRPFEEATVLGVGGLIERVRPALPAPGRPAGAGPSRQPRPSAEEA